ncbi:heavy metal translocating P-type ATPase [Crocinitomix algicola]|uniref:heavy metal translocating P-type ATPase n=1 Tax=Crocinitomix algicola TaxID=1740263 RepID=UPI000871EDDF|nr:heavy metal translocating P-type ATPase metal-binding domain-containing protein [Crocinitomix algicola]
MNCYHCGEHCETDIYQLDNHQFCCNGCLTVYDILHSNGMDKFYDLSDRAPGIKARGEGEKVYYDFLDLEDYQKKHILFKDDKRIKVELYLPQVHCNSCIWLLENINKINTEIVNSELNFGTKVIQVTIKNTYSLKQLAQFLDQLGYPPEFSSAKKQRAKMNKTLIYKIGVAGFCFGNIMLLSFPEYLGLTEDDISFRKLFLILSFFLSLPVLFYAGFDYLKYAYYGLKNRVFNMELPIAIGLIALFLRSSYELFEFNEQAYFDSLAGLVFFLLIGKWYQEKTFANLRFQSDKRSYFPMAIQQIVNKKKEIIKTEEIELGMKLAIRNFELIPTDSQLLSDKALIDYSFVTGESEPVKLKKGEIIFAGGRLIGSPAEVLVVKSLNEGYLTGLWNAKSIHENPNKDNKLVQLSNAISRYFTVFLILLSLATGLYWYFVDSSLIWRSVVAVLIVACPCALALSIPFTYGTALSAFGKFGLFFRKSEIIDQLTHVTDIVFDKTGTLTTGKGVDIIFEGSLSDKEKKAVYSGCSNSMHPLSQTITDYLGLNKADEVQDFSEIQGKGLVFSYNDTLYKIGSAQFLGIKKTEERLEQVSMVYIKKEEKILGNFQINHAYRKGLKTLLAKLSKQYHIHVLSGDNDRAAAFLRTEYGLNELHFNQSPIDKANYIQNLQRQGKNVLMLGDGINDSEALEASYFGIAVTNMSQGFKPSSDAIINGDALVRLNEFFDFAHYSKRVVITSFIISFLYNIIGLTIAVQGIFAPVLAAILMPISSLTVVLVATLSIKIRARNRKYL